MARVKTRVSEKETMLTFFQQVKKKTNWKDPELWKLSEQILNV